MTVELVNKIHYFAKLDSTMLEAKKCITLQKSCPRLIIAGEQTQGKGRFGRIWFAPKGNLYVTIIQPIEHPIDQIPIIVGVAVAEVLIQLIGQTTVCHSDERQDPEKSDAINTQCEISLLDSDVRQNDKSGIVTLKHPNDVLIDGKKICGILIEKYEPFYSVGIGINIVSSPLVQSYETTFLHQYNPNITVGFLLRCFLKRYQALFKQDFAGIQDQYINFGAVIPLSV